MQKDKTARVLDIFALRVFITALSVLHPAK
jgi:hypothetical protein